MNIFVVDECPIESARMLCDKHIVKMPIESAQMLSTTHRFVDGASRTAFAINGRKFTTWGHPDSRLDGFLYRSTMINHPCTVWTRENIENYMWHAEHAMELCREYTRRYDRIHGSQNVIEWCLHNVPKNIQNGTITQWAQAMPTKYQDRYNSVQAYRNYYIGDKMRFAKWKNTQVPFWWPTEKNLSENRQRVLTTMQDRV